MDQEHAYGQRFEGLELLERFVLLRLGIRPDNSARFVGHDRAIFIQPRLLTAVDFGIEYIVRCHGVRTTRELVEDLRRAEFDEGFVSPVLAASSNPAPYHFLWDDIDKLKTTDFKTEVLFDLVDSLYRQKHGLTVTSNYSMRDLVEHERMHPAIVRRLDDRCRVIEA